MKKLILIIAIVIFIVVTGLITITITKQIFENATDDLSQEQLNNLTPKDIINQLAEDRLTSLGNLHKTNLAGHEFELAYLNTQQYKTTGNKDISFTKSGWYAPSYSMPRSKLLDVDLSQKVKLKITADFEGEMKSTNEDCTGYCITTEKYHFSEFAIYIIDGDGDRVGMRVLGTRHNIIQGNKQDKYKFTELVVENTGEEIVITDSTGYTLSYSKDFEYVTTEAGKELNRDGNYGKLNPDQRLMLGINCHVNGEGYCKLQIKEIQIQ